MAGQGFDTATVWRNGLGRSLLVLAIVFGLASCTKSYPETLLTDYQVALQRWEQSGMALELDHDSAPHFTLLVYPRHRDRTLPVDEQRLGFGDYLGLYDCELFYLINTRNSVLGKVMPPSQVLHYEIRFLQAAEECRQQVQGDGDDSLLQRLDAIIALKTELLPRVFWNATFDSEEMATALSISASPLAAGNWPGFESSLAVISYFQTIGEHLYDPNLTVDSSVLESHFEQLQRYQFGGRLAVTVASLVNGVPHLLKNLQRLADNSAWCDASAEQRQPLVDIHYQRFTPYLQAVYQRGQRWQRRLAALLNGQAVTPPPAMRHYHRQMLGLDGELWVRFSALHHRYQSLWSQLSVCTSAPAST